MSCIERFEADRAAILGVWNSGDWVDIKYEKRQKMAYIDYAYKCTVQYLSSYVALILGLLKLHTQL